MCTLFIPTPGSQLPFRPGTPTSFRRTVIRISRTRFFQTVSGLTAGTTYTLQFQQAAGQQVGFSGATTEQWKVFLGVGGIGVDCSTNPCTVTGTANNIEEDLTLMMTPSEMNVNWNSVTLSFTPTAADLTDGTAVLTFLAWGDNGSTTNLPPTVFLEGVNTTPVPEPWTLAGPVPAFSVSVGSSGVTAQSATPRSDRSID